MATSVHPGHIVIYAPGGMDERHPCLSPEVSLRLFKFVPDEFVTLLPPCCNPKYLEDNFA
ncbi:hypothetical protein DLB09_05255 [Salmonella enterica subsp. salamae]|nr:hypothetical protein [Salmonella enterica subsp. salamae]